MRALARPQVLAVALAMALSRLPVAMAPLALVFLVGVGAGNYPFGAVLAGVYAMAEAAGALVLGPRLDRGPMRWELSGGMVASGAAFAAATTRVPAAVTLTVVALAGFAAAGAPGGLRTLLGRSVPEDVVAAAFSAEVTLNQIIWALSPALVSLLAVAVAPEAPFVLAALSMAAAGTVVFLLPAARCVPAAAVTCAPDPAAVRRAPDKGAPAPGGAGTGIGGSRPGATAARAMRPHQGTSQAGRRTLWSAWPIYLTSAAAMYLLATVELVLPALLQHRGIPAAWSGPMLAGFAVTSIAGGVLYGSRRWPGTPRVQSLVLLVGIAMLVMSMSVLYRLSYLATALACAGFLQAALLTARNLSLRERLPAHSHAGGYSLMYAGSGIGYAVSGSVAATVLAGGTPVTAMAAGAGATVLLGAAAGVAEAGMTGRWRRRAYRVAPPAI